MTSFTHYNRNRQKLRDELPQTFNELLTVLDISPISPEAFYAELVWEYLMWRRDRNTSKENSNGES